ncbi:MAG: hypothetical protein V5A88_04485 [Candidatus Thermoplasmatota archaeon]
MAGRSATEMIWFAVSVIVAISLIGVFVGIAYQYSDSIQRNARGEAADYYVNVDIVNDPAMMPYDNGTNNLTIYAKNTGTYELDTSQTIVNVDGEMRAVDEDDVEILGRNDTDWTQGTVAKLNVTTDLETGEDHSVSIEVQGIFRGDRMGRDSDSLMFHLDS